MALQGGDTQPSLLSAGKGLDSLGFELFPSALGGMVYVSLNGLSLLALGRVVLMIFPEKLFLNTYPSKSTAFLSH